MFKYHNRKLLFCFLIGLLLLPAQNIQAQSSEDESLELADTDREDPFAQLVLATPKPKPQPEPIAEPEPIPEPEPVPEPQPEPNIPEPDPELFAKTVTLKFLNAKNLKDAIGNMSSAFGRISVDKESNSLIICDTNEVLEKILVEIGKADHTPPQIMIEAVIVDVQLDDDTEIGINWDFLSADDHTASYRQNLGSRLSMVAADATTRADATAFNTTSLTGVEGGYFALISGTIRNTVHLLQEKKNIEILASPRVMVVSGRTAMIQTIKELPYREVTQTGEGGELASTEFKEVGVKLEVRATLTDDKMILLSVSPEQSVNTGEFGTTSEIPIIDIRRANTTLLIEDGDVIIVGGLRKKEITDQVTQIPLLGDLPLIGFLFRNTKKVVKNSELIVFISPHIYKGERIPAEAMKKFNEITKRPILTMPKPKTKTKDNKEELLSVLSIDKNTLSSNSGF